MDATGITCRIFSLFTRVFSRLFNYRQIHAGSDLSAYERIPRLIPCMRSHPHKDTELGSNPSLEMLISFKALLNTSVYKCLQVSTSVLRLWRVHQNSFRMAAGLTALLLV
jgi:hypothetical protein